MVESNISLVEKGQRRLRLNEKFNYKLNGKKMIGLEIIGFKFNVVLKAELYKNNKKKNEIWYIILTVCEYLIMTIARDNKYINNNTHSVRLGWGVPPDPYTYKHPSPSPCSVSPPKCKVWQN